MSDRVLGLHTLFAFLVALTLCGCSSVRQFLETASAPSDPSTSALVLVECEVTEFLEDFDLADALFGLDNDVEFKSVILREDTGLEHRAYAQEGIFVFDDLRPGRYAVTTATAQYYVSTKMREDVYGCAREDPECPTWIEFEYPIPSLSAADLTFEVVPGDIVVLGTMRFWETHDPPFEIQDSELGTGKVDFHRHDSQPSIEITRYESDEIEMLETFLNENADSPWAEQVRERLKTLKQAK